LEFGPPLGVFGVGQPQISGFTAIASGVPQPFPFRAVSFSRSRRASQNAGDSPSCAIEASGVGHPVRALSDVGRARACSCNIDSPDGIATAFKVSPYSMEPVPASLASNLLSHNDGRTAIADESIEVWPKMPWIFISESFPRDRDWLAGSRSGKDRPVVRPSGLPERVRPSAIPAEEMAGCVSFEISGLNKLY
jgi:hypothetical protein